MSTLLSTLPVLDLKNPTKPENYLDRPYAKGTPLNWRDDVTLTLQPAVDAFFHGNCPANLLELVIAYVQYHIHATCWLETCPWDVDEDTAREIRALRELSLTLKTESNIRAYINRALDLAIDPF